LTVGPLYSYSGLSLLKGVLGPNSEKTLLVILYNGLPRNLINFKLSYNLGILQYTNLRYYTKTIQ